MCLSDNRAFCQPIQQPVESIWPSEGAFRENIGLPRPRLCPKKGPDPFFGRALVGPEFGKEASC